MSRLPGLAAGYAARPTRGLRGAKPPVGGVTGGSPPGGKHCAAEAA
jgi:hypothetical protein